MHWGLTGFNFLVLPLKAILIYCIPSSFSPISSFFPQIIVLQGILQPWTGRFPVVGSRYGFLTVACLIYAFLSAFMACGRGFARLFHVELNTPYVQEMREIRSAALTVIGLKPVREWSNFHLSTPGDGNSLFLFGAKHARDIPGRDSCN